MPSIYIREWPTDAPHDLARQEGTLLAARLMVNSAITAPVIGGVPLIECNLVYGRQEMEKVSGTTTVLPFRPTTRPGGN